MSDNEQDPTVTIYSSNGGYSVKVDADQLAAAGRGLGVTKPSFMQARMHLMSAAVPAGALGRLPNANGAYSAMTEALQAHLAAMQQADVSVTDLAQRLTEASDMADVMQAVTTAEANIGYGFGGLFGSSGSSTTDGTEGPR